MKVQINLDTCTSNALCMAFAPQVFQVRDDGYLYLLDDDPPPELWDAVRRAANNCPTGSITLVEE